MSRCCRAASSLLVTIAIVALPVVLDYCVASCDEHQTLAVAASCHHGSPASPATAVGRAASSCGHDHIASGAEQAIRIDPLRRGFAPAPAVVIGNLAPAADISVPAIPQQSPGSSLILFAQSLPLRI
jgi:hypothetical protein